MTGNTCTRTGRLTSTSTQDVKEVGTRTQAVLHHRRTLEDEVWMTKTEVPRCLWPHKDQLALAWPFDRTVPKTGVNVCTGQSNFTIVSPYGPLRLSTDTIMHTHTHISIEITAVYPTNI